MLCNKISQHLFENAGNDTIGKQLCMIYIAGHYSKQVQIEIEY